MDPTMMVALSTLALEQATAMEAMAEATTQLLSYAATRPDAISCYKASGMVLYIYSDGSYLSKTKSCSRAGGHFYLGSKENGTPINNGAILMLSTIQKMVVSLVAEAKLGRLFSNIKKGTVLCNTLQELRHPQPATPL